MSHPRGATLARPCDDLEPKCCARAEETRRRRSASQRAFSRRSGRRSRRRPSPAPTLDLVGHHVDESPLIRGAALKPGPCRPCRRLHALDCARPNDAALHAGPVCRQPPPKHDRPYREVMIPMASGAITETDIRGDLHDLVQGRAGRGARSREITVFKNGGGRPSRRDDRACGPSGARGDGEGALDGLRGEACLARMSRQAGMTSGPGCWLFDSERLPGTVCIRNSMGALIADRKRIFAPGNRLMDGPEYKFHSRCP